MSQRRQKLELRWVGKDRVLLGLDADGKPLWGDWSNIDPRPLWQLDQIGDPKAENLLIKGDNLYALKALERDFADQIKCIYIDLPFNTRNAFLKYDDSVEHSIWLSIMKPRLEILQRLLKNDGVIFVHIDNEENHYLKVLMDEIFSRKNFLGQVAYERSGVSGIGQGGTFLVNTHEQILSYAKSKTLFRVADQRGDAPFEKKDMKRYCKIMVQPGMREEVARFIAPATGEPVIIFKHFGEEIRTVSLRNFERRRTEILEEYVRSFKQVFRNTSIQEENDFQNRILSHCKKGLYSADYLVSRGKKEGQRITAYYLNTQVFAWLSDTAIVRDGGIFKTNKLSDFWPHGDIPKADLANEGGVEFRRGKKPEGLLMRLIRLVTNEGDWVLDSFLGSGGTAAVANKMGRKWIGIESGEHADSLCLPRLKSVVSGKDQTGISKQVGWKGGGGFRYCVLGEPLLTKDPDLGVIVNPNYENGRLVAAVCKFEGFKLNNDETFHGVDGKRFAHVTEDQVTQEYLDALTEQLGENESLYIYCTRRAMRLNTPDNVRIKRMPKDLLKDRPDLFKHGQH